MVDASTACRMNPLAALGIDRSGLMHEGLRVHGGMVYPPGIHTLPTEKAREGASLPLGYVSDRIPDLYKQDVSLDARKATNGYVGLYKSPPPGLQKPMVVPGAGADVLGLDRRVGPGDKPSELGLNGSSSFLGRLPWMSNPYHEAAMYPFLDSSKYAALNMYKASFMSQPSHYLPQHLAYQPGAERLFYMSPYPPAPISSPLAPPLRIPTATVAPTTLSPLMHCQDKSLASMGPRIHHEPSAFGQQLHQHQQLQPQPQAHHQAHSDRQHCHSSSSDRQHGISSDRQHGISSDRQHGISSDRQHGISSDRQHGISSDRQHGISSSSSDRQHGISSSSSSDRQHGSSSSSSSDRQHGISSDRQHGISSSSSSSDRQHGISSDRQHCISSSSGANGTNSIINTSSSSSGGGGGCISKSSRTPSSRSSSSSSSSVSSSSSSSASCVSSSASGSTVSTCHLVDTSPASVMHAPRPSARPAQPAGHPPPPPLVDSTLDYQKFRSPSSTASSASSTPVVSHPFYMSSGSQEHRSPLRSTSHKPKPKDGSAEHRGGQAERKASKSPSRTPSSASSERPAPQPPTKDPADKPLDLSAKILDFEGPPNGFPPKLEALAKLGYPPPSARYGLPPSRELLKETLSPSAGTSSSSKTPERPEIISTLHSSWVVPHSAPTPPTLNPDAGQNKGPSVIKNKNLEHVAAQPRSSSCPRIGEANNVLIPTPAPAPVIVTPVGRPSSTSPSPKPNGEWTKSNPTPSEKVAVASRVGSHQQCVKAAKPSKKPEPQEIPFKPQQSHLENGHPSGHLYMPQSEAYMSPGLAYANRYLPYPVPDSMSLSHLQLSGKGPVYPHPVLLGSANLYPARLPPKHGLPYGLPPSHGEYLTYHDPQEMVHPLMSPHLLDPKVSERLELRSRHSQDKSWHHEESPYKRPGMTENEALHKADREALDKVDALSSKGNKSHASASAAGGREEIICIDLIQDDADGGGGGGGSQANKYSVITAKRRDPCRPGGGGNRGDGKEPELMQILRCGQQPTSESQAAEADGQHEPAASRARPPEPAEGLRPESAEHSQDEDSMSEHSPLPALSEEQTLRCARTSGDRTSDESDYKAAAAAAAHGNSGSGAAAIHRYMDLGPKEAAKDEEAHESHEDEEDCGHGSSKSRRSSLTKRIANSSGYVGDRFKCVTTELYADSSKLGREQRALQPWAEPPVEHA
ncbi:BCL-6 corepressor [Alosa pseudoharengus]|uniref:BCL-6 corepressor n=1 Tax=Alosa pseudoharengus TaxID=34774 RepID=UPI003F8BD2BC